MTTDLDRRLQALEEALTHRDQDLQDLSDMITQQWARIERLELEIKRLNDRLGAVEADTGDAPAADQKPPHW